MTAAWIVQRPNGESEAYTTEREAESRARVPDRSGTRGTPRLLDENEEGRSMNEYVAEMDHPYHGKTIAEIVHDYAVIRGDLVEQYARDQLTRIIEVRLAQAWQEGHMTYRRLGPDNCECEAWNESECGCGEYGSNVITPNPYQPGVTTEESA